MTVEISGLKKIERIKLTDEFSKEDIKNSISINHIIDEMITIEGGFKLGETFLFCSPNNPKSVIAIVGNCSSGLTSNELLKLKDETEKE